MIASITADVILKEDIQESKSLTDVWTALQNYSYIQLRLTMLRFIEFSFSTNQYFSKLFSSNSKNQIQTNAIESEISKEIV